MGQINTDIDFDAADEADYVYDDAAVEFASGVARTFSSFNGDTLIITPRVITTFMQVIHKVVPAVQEASNYYHFFAVAFAETSLDPLELAWKKHGVAGWVDLEGESLAAGLFANGMRLEQVLAIRDWPLTGSIRFAVGVRRVDGGGY